MTVETDLLALTENVDATYDDQSPGDAVHQQDHDRIHRLARALIEAGADQTEVVAILAGLLTPTFLPKAGGTMTGALALHADPSVALGAATKQYVDAAGAMKLIGSSVLVATATSISFTSIPATYRHLTVIVNGRSNRAGVATDPINVQFNGDTAANYDTEYTDAAAAAAPAAENLADTSIFAGRVAAATASAGAAGGSRILIPDYRGTTFQKLAIIHDGYVTGTASGTVHSFTASGRWRSTAAINRVDLVPAVGPFAVGTVASLYGIV